MKKCRTCKRIKTLSDFYKYKSGKKEGYYYSECKVCHSLRFKRFWDKGRKEFNGLYGTWRNIIGRCNNPKDRVYKYYGGRGIKVCKEWQDSFQVFYEWAKDKHRKGLTIDRRNNNDNYTPTNCQFITQAENNRNKSTTYKNRSKL